MRPTTSTLTVSKSDDDFVTFDQKFARPGKPQHLRADTAKAFRQLGWLPRYLPRDLIRMLVRHAEEATP